MCAPGLPNLCLSFFCLGCMRLCAEWSLLRVRLLCGMAACGRVVVTAQLQELEQSVTISCSVLCPVSFKDLLGCKRLLLYFDGGLCLEGSSSCICDSACSARAGRF